ncbi:MAG TPA: hypothetical protein VMK65_01900 [Longimicrobiales bacterium]|nr:hypothetical protein [Longimicrobiales bacterium]
MAGKLSPGGQVKVAALEDITRQVQHSYALVEQFAAARTGQEGLGLSMRRQFRRLKTKLTLTGYDQLGQIAGTLELTAGRGMGAAAKTRILREGVASLKFQLSQEHTLIMREEARLDREEKARREES